MCPADLRSTSVIMPEFETTCIVRYLSKYDHQRVFSIAKSTSCNAALTATDATDLTPARGGVDH